MTPAMLFNGYVGAHAFYALHELGVLRRWEEGTTKVAELAPHADEDRLVALLVTMARLGFVTLDGTTAELTPTGRELVQQQGFFTWCVGGHGDVWRQLAGLAGEGLRFGQDVRRNDGRVALGCAEADRALMRPTQDEVLGSIDFTTAVDIGCGDGSRLLELCSENPERHGIGIDISADACAMAAEQSRKRGLADRVDFVQANVIELLKSDRTFPGADLVVSIFMLHDLFASTDDHPELVRSLRRVFPDARYFLLADTAAQDEAERREQPPIFSLGFELAHSFMGVRLQARSTYEEAFEAGGLKIARREPFGAPSTWLYLLEAV
ncbi:class I SAM-dependent methyltransferase [Streptomyces sp. NPDC054766]|uniref:class I SAM-dependent methyltransferase n=1 Tax=Streptomyces rhizosphaerihabitans TaxID=1266770 RepID=UPI0021C0F34A|nr:class I SAM-dependent methyltransferase [Streptomyces rhizosphaerihabitans]MCT9008499.1 methyltransferase domain-containing protein [Streptomyces rhizosphaerihabitans]